MNSSAYVHNSTGSGTGGHYHPHNGLLYLLEYHNGSSYLDDMSNNGTHQPGGSGTAGAAGGRPKYPPSFFRRRPSDAFRAVTTISYYTCPAILVVGVISNVMAYLVFTRTRLRKVPSVPYLAAMAVVDTGALVTEFITVVLSQHGVQVITQSGVCQYVTYLNYVFIFLCMWYPVALCLEKFIGVYYPLRKASLCTTFKAKVVVIGMAVFTGVCYHYIIYMTGPVNNRFLGVFCGTWVEFKKDFNILMKLDFVFVRILPCLVLVVLVVLILARGCGYYRNSSAIELGNRASTSRTSSTSASPILITNVVFFVVLIMLLLKLPLSIVRFYGFIDTRLVLQLDDYLQPLFLYMSRLDWAVKLYVYLVFSPAFRKSFRSFFRSSCSKIRDRWGLSSNDSAAAAAVAVAVEEDNNRRQRNRNRDADDNNAIVSSPRIHLADRIEAGHETRACLVTSADV